jgi:hypothetical protein
VTEERTHGRTVSQLPVAAAGKRVAVCTGESQ